ncbi:uncharacterized protein LOC116200073 [Punica granatum]|uniref:Calponin homology domain-containing protein DDB_G0272472 n=2 Tax=Punica granatum TaxID=22663 RepID=A0A218X8V0_PUNGR|nr:uncharacterized protein LOC116200073 [Punica granatum]OWM81140.1 hypothetical protein CDL15_Pgr007171 [Punica granatum]PKI39052.1 hypothetical protein CRG98_040558 [Punica granatum]
MDGEVVVEVSSPNGKIKEQCGVDASPCHDLPNGGSSLDCNGVKSVAVVEGIENGNGKEDADRTYVFVNGSDDVAEIGDNDENCIMVAPAEESVGNCGELKSNGEIEAGEAKVNGCNGHCDFEKVDAIIHEAAEVENGKSTSHENGDCIKEDNGVLVAEESKGESVELCPVEEVEVVNSAESEVLGVVNSDEKVEVESSFEVVEKVPITQDDHADAEGSNHCQGLSANAEALLEQVESTSDIVEEVPESQAVNDVETEGSRDCKEPAETTAELPEKIESTAEVVEAVPESHGDADGSDDTKGLSEITEQQPLQAESISEVSEEVPNSQSTIHVDADCSCGCCQHAVDMPVEVESTSEDIGEIPGSQQVSNSDAEGTGDCPVLSKVTVENTADLSEQPDEDQKCEATVTATAASELITGNNEKEVVEERESSPIKEDKAEVSSQLSPNAEIPETQESVKIQVDDASNDVEQQESVEVAAESPTTDQLKSVDGEDDQIAKCTACPESTDINTASSQPSENGQSFESDPVPSAVSAAKEDGDSAHAIIETKEPGSAPESAEISASPADCINVSVESAECHPTAVPLHADIPAPALDDMNAELAAVNDDKATVSKVEVGNTATTSSDGTEMEGGTHEGSSVADDTSASHCSTMSTETKICFGSISHEELSSISSAVTQPSADSESPENDGSDRSTSQGAEVIDATLQNDGSPAEGSSNGVTEARPVVPEVVKRFFNQRVRVPRYDAEDLKEQMIEAQARVDEKTRIRDAIQAEIQMIKATRKGYSVEIEAASAEEQSARDLWKSKRNEIDTVQSVMSKLKNAMDIDDIDSRIHSMEHRIEHETLPLKEEKQLLRDIKLLRQHREQLSSRIGKQDELKEALEQKEQTEERLKVLRKEAELLRGTLSRAEGVTKAAKKKQYDGIEKLRELQDQFKAADAVRQEAYAHLQSLRKQSYEKNKYFYKYKDDANISSDLGSKGDRDGVSQFCIKQVDDFMKLWLNNVEFRSDYIGGSLRGTLRRLGTKDGRSLGLDEQPLVIPPYPIERIAKDNPTRTPAFPSLVQAKAQAAPVETDSRADNAPVKPMEQKKPNSIAKAPAKPSEAVALASPDAVRDDEAAKVTEEPKRTKEEEEKARREEELSKEEEAARLKEQRRLEEKAKAEAALERKRRIAERAQARAAAKAQKEAEQKEKEREKRLKKKERKNAGGSEPTDAANEGEPVPSAQTPTETPRESETREKVETAAKRHQKPVHFARQTKVKSTIPPPLRNRGKRKMQPWMWVLLVAVLVLALFLAGNGRRLF